MGREDWEPTDTCALYYKENGQVLQGSSLQEHVSGAHLHTYVQYVQSTRIGCNCNLVEKTRRSEINVGVVERPSCTVEPPQSDILLSDLTLKHNHHCRLYYVYEPPQSDILLSDLTLKHNHHCRLYYVYEPPQSDILLSDLTLKHNHHCRLYYVYEPPQSDILLSDLTLKHNHHYRLYYVYEPPQSDIL